MPPTHEPSLRGALQVGSRSGSMRTRPTVAVPLVVFVAAVLVALAHAPTALAAAPAEPATREPSTLDRTFADIDLLDGPVASRVLVVAMEALNGDRTTRPTAARAVIVDVLARDRSWTVAGRVRIVLGTTRLVGPPWLVRFGAQRYALLLPIAAATRIVPVRIVEGLPTTEAAIDVARQASAATAADVDGDGLEELVLAGPSPLVRPRHQPCATSALTILDGRFEIVRSSEVDGYVLTAGATVAELDGDPGPDLAAIASPCRAPQDVPLRRTLIGLRLRDGTLISPSLADGDPWHGQPLAIDVDGDGQHELVARSGVAAVVVDPGAGWRVSRIAPEAWELGALPGSDQAPGLDPGEPARGALVALGSPTASMVVRLTRDGPGAFAVTEVARYDAAETRETRWARALLAVRDAADRGVPPNSLSLQLDRTTASTVADPPRPCPSLLVPLAVFACPDVSQEAPRPGPALVATRPLGIVGGMGDRILSAESIEWRPGQVALVEPTPLAAWGRAGGWRGGPSVPFVLAELAKGDLGYFPRFPVPTPTVERTSTGIEPQAFVAGWSGTRYLVRADPVREDVPEARTALDEFLATPPRTAEGVALLRSPVAPGGRTGIDHAAASIRLPELEDTRVERWLVQVVEINGWGEISEPAQQLVDRDLDGPRLAVSAPLVSPLWPFPARLQGESEPGATVRVEGGDRAEVDRSGRFVVPARLAPWPQAIEIRATDRSGNETVARLDVVGGLDYRRIPWGPLSTVALMVVLAVAWGRRRPVPAELAADADAGGEPIAIQVGRSPGSYARRFRDVEFDESPGVAVQTSRVRPTRPTRRSGPGGRS